jgi:DNA helicase-2/ATP-dependent DNA helicase PcrA
MTEGALALALAELTEIQRRAVEWGSGPLLVLAGPGSGKTQVLTCRIAGLLDASRDKNFRVLALTFTNKAADEMKGRVASFVPGIEERANIGTFHSFCAQVLRQHGVHLGIKPDFTIYALDADRGAVLEDALRNASSQREPVRTDDVRYLGLIDRMKARLIEPEGCERVLTRFADASRIALTYRLYEDELRRINALDFNSLILETHRLVATYPAIAGRYRRSHPYWLIDEFQDTNNAQFRLIKAMAGEEFRNLFAVADDDQIIYQWNGASFRNIESYLSTFSAELIQLPTNYRCPPAIVEAANKLVVYNVQRTSTKQPLIAGKIKLKLPEEQHIQLREFASEEDEADGIAREIAQKGRAQWGQTTVLARNRALLERMLAALQKHQVLAVIAQRRDDFLSAQLRWLVASLTQTVRPLDRRSFLVLVEAFNRITDIELSADQLMAEAEASGQGYLATWLAAANATSSALTKANLLQQIGVLVTDPASARTVVDKLLVDFQSAASGEGGMSDLAEDLAAWREISGDIARHLGRNAPLEQFLQELQLRSKEPSPKPDTVTLMTVHGAKGREFDYVYVIGMAEDILPSYQSRQKGDKSPEMEEERRNCFVAITRAKECLILSRADRYRGWEKQASRFLVEMELAA